MQRIEPNIQSGPSLHLYPGKFRCDEGFSVLPGGITEFKVLCRTNRWTPAWTLTDGEDLPRCTKVLPVLIIFFTFDLAMFLISSLVVTITTAMATLSVI